MNYTNVPIEKKYQGTDATIQAFSTYYSAPLELKASVFDAMVGFFTSRGFDKDPAQAITIAIITQSRSDGYNPMTVLDTLKKLNEVELNTLVTEIINHNRFKTSFLGYTNKFVAVQEVSRNIVA
jgi:hypothetical protein